MGFRPLESGGAGGLGGLLGGMAYGGFKASTALTLAMDTLKIEFGLVGEGGAITYGKGYEVGAKLLRLEALKGFAGYALVGLASGIAGGLAGGYVSDKVNDLTGNKPAASASGVVAGAAAGAAAGAVVGSFFGGVGAVPGAMVGAVVGAVAGAIGSWFSLSS